MIDKDKVISEDEQNISQEEQALQIEEEENPQNFITPSSSPTREVMPQRCEGVIHPSHPSFKPKRYSAPKIRSRDDLEQEKMFLQERQAEQNLSASELRLIDNIINQIEEEIKNLAKDLCGGPVSKSQKREGPSGDRDPGAGICSITVRRHTGTVLCKSETFVKAERIPNNEIVGLAGLVVSSFLVGYFLINFISRFDIDTIFRVMDFLEEDIMAEKELPKLNL